MTAERHARRPEIDVAAPTRTGATRTGAQRRTSTGRPSGLVRTFAAAAVLFLAAAACGNDGDQPVIHTGSLPAEDEAEPGGRPDDDTATPAVVNTWTRATEDLDDGAAIYGEIIGGTIDTYLQDVSVDPSVAAVARVRGVSVVDERVEGEMMDDVTTTRIDFAAGERVELAPDGYYIMLFELEEPLEAGTTFDLTLTFAEGVGDVVVPVEVREGEG